MSNIISFAERSLGSHHEHSIVKIIDGCPVRLVDIDAMSYEDRDRYLSASEKDCVVLNMQQTPRDKVSRGVVKP
jgi:hypothetical protein